MGYLDLLDEMLSTGTALLGEGFLRAQARYVESRQGPEGGFFGRSGVEDLYYTDFALRTLVLTAPSSAVFAALPGILTANQPPRDLIECFSYLNCRRMLQSVGCDPLPVPPSVHLCLTEVEDAQHGTSEASVSAYQTFVLALCHEMLGDGWSAGDEVLEGVQQLRRPEGGFAERADQTVAQTNATAAALAVLTMAGELGSDCATSAARFLVSMQTSEDGGFRAHPSAPEGDLLSSFTAFLALIGLAAVGPVDLAGLARFARTCARPEGGFSSCPRDAVPDVEYTYYGLGTLALLRAMISAS